MNRGSLKTLQTENRVGNRLAEVNVQTGRYRDAGVPDTNTQKVNSDLEPQSM